MNKKVNWALLLKVLLLEILYVYIMYFISLLALFLYFGSGAGASSETAIAAGHTTILLIILPPFIFNLYKIYHSKKKKQIEAYHTYLWASIGMVLFVICHFYMGFITL